METFQLDQSVINGNDFQSNPYELFLLVSAVKDAECIYVLVSGRESRITTQLIYLCVNKGLDFEVCRQINVDEQADTILPDYDLETLLTVRFES